MTLPEPDRRGMLQRHERFASQYIQPRPIDVWLPPAYDQQRDERYPVLYLHDGQNLFDPALANTGSAWGIDEALERLIHQRVIKGTIAVGIWHTAQRVGEYMPQEPLAIPSIRTAHDRYLREWHAEEPGQPQSDAYLHFIVAELKPFIDATYRTQSDRAHTAIMGSSMGGLISLYALCKYPAIFGGAGCLSTHWPIGEEALVEYFGRMLPHAGQHRLYFDYGTETIDALYEPYQLQMDELMRQAGYQRDRDWITRKFPGAAHNEAAWRDRVDIPLRFLLGTP